jgi:hypothetical protein
MNFIELVIDEEAELYGIDAISLVEQPAIESDFIAMNSQLLEFKTQDAEKRIVMGAALIPDKPIYRKNGQDEYYVYFSKKTVRRAMELYFKNGHQSNATLEHEHKINGLHVVESWIVEGEQDKSRLYGLEVPVGTWMVSMKVENDAIWQKFVKEGSVKGFSIEGYFANKYEMSRAVELDEDLVEMESYTDYPESATNAAKRAIAWKEKNGSDCGTRIGWTRARQLADRKPISRDVIARMASFARHAENKDVPYSEGCGGLMWDAWGGTAGIEWAKNKLDRIDASSQLLAELELELALLALEENLATIGPRGGVKRSRKAPKGDTPNRNPTGQGTAKGDASNTRSAKVTKKDEEALQKKSDEFNERYKKKLGYGVTVGMLKAVFQRGLGAFNVSHSPKVTSAKQWAHARVNAFLYLVKNGRPQNKKYTTDYDLLPSKHPNSKDSKK